MLGGSTWTLRLKKKYSIFVLCVGFDTVMSHRYTVCSFYSCQFYLVDMKYHKYLMLKKAHTVPDASMIWLCLWNIIKIIKTTLCGSSEQKSTWPEALWRALPEKINKATWAIMKRIFSLEGCNWGIQWQLLLTAYVDTPCLLLHIE